MSHYAFKEDVARYLGAGLRAEYFWWPDDAPFDDLLKAHKQNEGSQIRTYYGITEDGRLTLWMCLFSQSGEYITGFDASHGCPPFCVGP